MSEEYEIKLVCEWTGNYSLPIITALTEANFFISPINPLLIKYFKQNTLHGKKTDARDAEKIADYGLSHWTKLTKYSQMDDLRIELRKIDHRRETVVRTKRILTNSLISLSDDVFPGVNKLFSRNPRKQREKWVDFFETFWHAQVIADQSLEEFKVNYKSFCRKYKYRYMDKQAEKIYNYASNCLTGSKRSELNEKLVKMATKEVQTFIKESYEMDQLLIKKAKQTPEYECVINMTGTSDLLAAQLIAEIGDISRFNNIRSLVAYAGLDPDTNQSGSYNRVSNPQTKRGNVLLRKVLFLVIQNIIIHKPLDDPLYQYIDKKRNQGKPYRVYMNNGCAKFLRKYYGKVKEFLK